MTENDFPADDDSQSASRDNVTFDTFPQSIKSIVADLRIVIEQIDLDFKQAREFILKIVRQLVKGDYAKEIGSQGNGGFFWHDWWGRTVNKWRWDQLKERRHAEDEAVQVNERKDNVETDNTDKANSNVNSDRESKPGDSDFSSNARIPNEEIALLFRMATDKLDKVEANAKKEKQQIVRDLARRLESFRPIDRMASEIVEELREKVSKSVIYAALDERYKTSYRVQNARKRNKEKEKTESLAPTSKLKHVIIDTSDHSTRQLVSEPESSEDYDNNKPQRQIAVT